MTDAIEFDRLLTSAECAKLLRVTERHLHNLRKRGGLPFVRLGGRVLYRPDDLRAYIERQTVTV